MPKTFAVFLQLVGVVEPYKQQALSVFFEGLGVQNKLHYNNQQRAYACQNIHTRTAAHTYCGSTPYDCGGGESVQAFSAEKDYAGPQESDSRNNLRSNTGGVAEFVERVAYAGKQGRSKSHGKMRAHARFLLTARTFDTYRQSKQTAYSYS